MFVPENCLVQYSLSLLVGRMSSSHRTCGHDRVGGPDCQMREIESRMPASSDRDVLLSGEGKAVLQHSVIPLPHLTILLCPAQHGEPQ